MKKFLNWLFSFLTPNKEEFVKNIQGEKSSDYSDERYAAPMKRRKSHEILGWTYTENILGVEEDQQGQAIEFRLKKGSAFSIIATSKAPKVESKKQGLSKVKHRLELFVEPEHELNEKWLKAIEKAQHVSILHADASGENFIYGKKAGLKILEKSDKGFILSGEETDVFYTVSESCLRKMLPIIEKE